MAVSPEEFRRVSMCETTKEVWDLLETTHEGTKTVKNSKLQMLASWFGEIRMKEDEWFDEFYAKLKDIINSSFNLGEKILETKIVRKVLRSLLERFRPKVTVIEESKDLDKVKIEELVESLQTYELTISQPKKSKSIALNTIKENESESTDAETLRDDEIAYFVEKFQKVLRNKKKYPEWKKGVPSKFRKTRGFGHYKNECPHYRKNLNKGRGKALVVSLTDDEFNSSEQSDSSSSENERNYMAFVSRVKSESDKESEKAEEEKHSENSEEESEDEIDIHETYQLLFKESLKIKRVNKAMLKKVDELERKKERLAGDLQDSSKNLSELRCVNEKLEVKVRTLTSDLEKSNTQLQSFLSGTKKLDNLLGMNKLAGNRQGLGYIKHDNNAASSSKTTFVLASNISSNITNLEPENKSVLGQRTSRIHRTTTPKNRFQQSCGFELRFIPTCHNCGVLGHTRPRCHKLMNIGRSKDIHSQVNFLSNLVSHLIEMMTKLTMITSTSRKV
ncbi:girdin-like [Olea europaea var. sylvestris]|uniref:girdin-like n=1 Tax=Olea europaea var. sylvestris TaxID=158386 RepID=UPI000C1D1446|nr:girdin-like [Olea europaea var. sylvestris]